MTTTNNSSGVIPFVAGAVIGSACMGLYYKLYGKTKKNSHNADFHPNRKEKENTKIKEINNSPLELRKRFENKGWVFVYQNLATLNVELNEFVELMRKYDLNVLDGCKDPDRCSC